MAGRPDWAENDFSLVAGGPPRTPQVPRPPTGIPAPPTGRFQPGSSPVASIHATGLRLLIERPPNNSPARGEARAGRSGEVFTLGW